ncbi:MAG: hypothetical protein KBT02_12360 [Treponema sp.]|nr:hypothetical protein [Candidatus Treponema caballi]
MSDFNTEQSGMHLDAATKEKLDEYYQKKARNYSLAICLYISSIAVLILEAAAFDAPITGVCFMFLLIAAATALIVYSNMLIPVDLIPYVKGKKLPEFTMSHMRNPRKVDAFMKLYWMIVTIIYLGVSFSTGRWGITWLIWLIAAAVKEAIYLFAGAEENEE